MKKTLLLGAALGIFVATVSAHGADLANEETPPSAPMVEPVYNWTGFYIGGDIGGYGANQSATTTAFPAGFGAPAVSGAGFAGIGILPTSHSLDRSGFLGGVHAGYNWQAAPNWLLGVEGSALWLGGSASDTKTTFDTFAGTRSDGSMTLSTDNDSYLASIRARVGLVRGQWMVYATGGPAWTNTRTTATWTPIPGALSPAPSASTASFGGTKTGFAIGAGGEWMLSQHWLLRAEYMYYAFNGASGDLPFTVGGSNGCTPAGTCGWNASSSNLHFNTGLVGLSYKF